MYYHGFSLAIARRGGERSSGGIDIELGYDQGRDDHAKQYSRRGLRGEGRDGERAVRPIVRLDGQSNQLFAVFHSVAELRAARDRPPRHIRLRELPPQLVRATVHQHSQRADTVLFQSAYLHVGAAGIHGGGDTGRSGRVLGQQARARHAAQQAYGATRSAGRGEPISKIHQQISDRYFPRFLNFYG